MIALAGTLVAGVVAFRLLASEYGSLMARFERAGYRWTAGQFIEAEERITSPTIFVGQDIRVRHGSDRGLALVCQTAELEGEICGNVHFIGQVLTVQGNAHLLRDLDVRAQTVNLYGIVDGRLTGVYETLNREPGTTDTRRTTDAH